MSTAADDDYEATAQATAWIADATRRFAGLSESELDADERWSQTGAALRNLRASITQRISALPRQGKPIRTSQPGINVSHIALAKLLTSALAQPAADVAAAIADVELRVDAEQLTAVHVHLIGVGAEPRDRTYLQDGDALRREAARVVHAAIGENAAEITASWDDVVIT
ncbi:uncharacterized protein RMCC_5104 [Mycolicibacterium canariasense]|uniref:Uncharacterized protein n=1 Tax=Mycolicibacterium canariasense TaxID=228230 RepID=A0A100WHS2_MYCCR|nr:hypothetical protein [Mycolicibacterium canariasense]MCV7212999.1 hypothetical protein [Mycolicibacterium canariasense]ORV10205.1 hypothetical protein AWB94_07765 [Mycolicibacterium canariasense]GAS98139.1 uncharacterized protein RMCC_5104 [Mycolicibacterium canariasense]